VFNPNGLPDEGGGVTSGQNGVDINNNYFSTRTPGLYFTAVTATGAFAFTPGASTGLAATDAAFALSNPAPAPASQTAGAQGQTLTLTFVPNSFTGGDVFRFTIGRALARGPNVSNAGGSVLANYNADLFGGGVLIPEGTVFPDGMRFRGTLSNGADVRRADAQPYRRRLRAARRLRLRQCGSSCERSAPVAILRTRYRRQAGFSSLPFRVLGIAAGASTMLYGSGRAGHAVPAGSQGMRSP
jgi:hypothetical protein